MKKKLLFLSLFSAFSFLSFSQTPPSEYKIANKISVEGDGGWDYLNMDDSTGRLYLSHGTVVQVLDVSQGKLIATITGLNGVHGIALAKELNKGFISSGRDTSVTIFDLKTFAVITKLKVTGGNPDCILYDPFTQRVFTFNGRGSNSTVIDAKTNAVIGTITLSGKPEFSVSDGKGNVYVNIEDKSELCRINPTTMKVEKTWSISPGKEASGLALDNVTHRLFIVCDNKLMIMMNAENGKVVAKLPIGEGVDGVAFDPEKKRAYSSNGDGTMTVVEETDANTFKVIENVTTQAGARTITVDKRSHHLYLPTAEYGAKPEPTADKPHPRPAIKPGSFVVLDIEMIKK